MMAYTPASNDTESLRGSDNCASGAYIFKPSEQNQQKSAYSTFEQMKTFEDNGKGAFWLRYAEGEKIYTLLVRANQLEAEDSRLDFGVQLHGIPIDDGLGSEVVAHWLLDDQFDSQQTFWTDSNGLEM